MNDGTTFVVSADGTYILAVDCRVVTVPNDALDDFADAGDSDRWAFALQHGRPIG